MLFSCNPIGQLCLGGPGYNSRTVNRLKPRSETITEGEHEGFIADAVQHNRSSTLGYRVRGTSNSDNTSITSLLILKRRLIEYGTKLFDLL